MWLHSTLLLDVISHTDHDANSVWLTTTGATGEVPSNAYYRTPRLDESFCHQNRIPQRFKFGVLRAGSMHMVYLQQERGSTLSKTIMLLVSLIAGILVFIPYAAYTSPFDAVMLNVPGDQGNWWHVLIGAPFFLAFPMIWLRLRAFFSKSRPLPLIPKSLTAFDLMSSV